MTLFFFTILASKRSELISEIESASNTINSYKASEELIVVLKNKVESADKILGSRTNYPNVFDTFSKLVPQGVYFADLKVSSGKVTISGKAKTSADVAGLVSSLLSAEGTKVISAISVDSLNSDEEGIYSFVISGKLPKS
ncbi:PilN domain-containing protein [Candidatus Curtissbacteria bacterium]|nr:PilN domain-containing protein [Candidatus Curtissbacteria bacterium]